MIMHVHNKNIHHLEVVFTIAKKIIILQILRNINLNKIRIYRVHIRVTRILEEIEKWSSIFSLCPFSILQTSKETKFSRNAVWN
jgi:hypothetical protein